MRYRNLEQTEFKNVYGESKKIYPVRREEIGSPVSIFPKLVDEDFDAIAVKVFGNNSEFRTYRLRDQNIALLLTHDFDESKLVKVEVGDIV
jgi:hypothetical protein